MIERNNSNKENELLVKELHALLVSLKASLKYYCGLLVKEKEAVLDKDTLKIEKYISTEREAFARILSLKRSADTYTEAAERGGFILDSLKPLRGEMETLRNKALSLQKELRTLLLKEMTGMKEELAECAGRRQGRSTRLKSGKPAFIDIKV